MGDRIVGIKEAAKRLNRHPQTLRIMCRDGRSPIPCVLTSSGWEFRDSDITRYIANLFGENEIQPQPPHAEAG